MTTTRILYVYCPREGKFRKITLCSNCWFHLPELDGDKVVGCGYSKKL